MSWMFGVCRLALSLGFFAGFDFDACRGMERPLAHAHSQCSSPIQTVGYQCTTGPDGLQRVGVDFQKFAPEAVVEEDTPQYTVEVRQTGKRDCTLTWPKVTLFPKQRAMVSTSTSGKAWLLSLHLSEVVGDKATVEVGLTGRGEDGKVLNYKGKFAAKLGACNLTALGGHDLPEPLAVSICVKKPEGAGANVRVLPNPMPTPAQPVIGSRLVAPMPPPLPMSAPFPVVTQAVPPPMVAPPVAYPVFTERNIQVYTRPTPVQPCLVYSAAVVPAKVVTLVKVGEKSKLAMRSAGLTTTAMTMTLDTPVVGKVTVAAGKKYVHVKAIDFTATADRVEVCGDVVKLCGHVKLSCEKIGPGAEVKAECLSVRVKDGSFVNFAKCECPAAGCCPGTCPTNICPPATVVPNRSN